MASPEPPAPYQVVVSGIVRQRIRELYEEAIARGDGPVFVASVKEFMARLVVYPQFGDPIIDPIMGNGQVRIGIDRLLSMRYGVHEERRLVFRAALPILLPMAGPDASAKE